MESGPDGDAGHLRTPGIDEALSRTDATGTLTYLPDALGSTLALADSGAASTTYTYAPFGETSVSGLPSSIPFQPTGGRMRGPASNTTWRGVVPSRGLLMVAI